MLVINAGEAATMRGGSAPLRKRALSNAGIVRDAAIAVRDGAILAVGPTTTIRSKYSSKNVIDAEGGLVTPGFVDPHTHLPFAGNRAFELALKLEGKTYEEILRAGGGIHRTVRDTRAASLDALVHAMRERMRIMLAWGTTTAEAKTGYGLDRDTEYKQLRAIAKASQPDGVELVPTFLGAHAIPTGPKDARKKWVDEIVHEIIPDLAMNSLAEFVDVFLERSAYSREEARVILRAAKRKKLKMKLHADEFTNQRGAEVAAELGTTSAEHLLEISPRGIRRLALSRTVACLLPGVAALGFLEHQAPARKMIDSGVAVALGSDFNPNCPVLTMPTILQWGVYQLRMRPAEALAACTRNAAHAVARGDRLGRIEAGFQADLLVHDVCSVEELAYWVGRNPVRAVVKNGRSPG